MTLEELKARSDLTAEQKAEIWLKQNVGESYYNEHLNEDVGISSFITKWVNFSYETTDKIADSAKSIFNYGKIIIVGIAVLGVYIIFKKVKR